jgi:hypothetical protein
LFLLAAQHAQQAVDVGLTEPGRWRRWRRTLGRCALAPDQIVLQLLDVSITHPQRVANESQLVQGGIGVVTSQGRFHACRRVFRRGSPGGLSSFLLFGRGRGFLAVRHALGIFHHDPSALRIPSALPLLDQVLANLAGFEDAFARGGIVHPISSAIDLLRHITGMYHAARKKSVPVQEDQGRTHRLPPGNYLGETSFFLMVITYVYIINPCNEWS